MTDLSRYFEALVSGAARAPADRMLLRLLKGLSYPYAMVLRLRALCYRLGIFRSYRLPVPVISVGNIVLGGTGKTPMTIKVASYFLAKGRRVAVLSRGYGGSLQGTGGIVSDGRTILATPEEAGDEPYLLAQKVPGLMVVVGGDRYAAGLLALRELKPDLFILDDGFQHLRLQRDLDLLLLHARAPFSNGFTLPAGFLRERPAAAARADAVVYTRSDRAGAPHLFPDKPSFWMRHTLTGAVPLEGGAPVLLEKLRGERVAAFSGIADPQAFFDLLVNSGVEVAARLPLPDHASFGEGEIAAICAAKASSGATVLITTEKDAVKLAPFRARLAPCYAAVLEMGCSESAKFEALLEKVL